MNSTLAKADKYYIYLRKKRNEEFFRLNRQSLKLRTFILDNAANLSRKTPGDRSYEVYRSLNNRIQPTSYENCLKTFTFPIDNEIEESHTTKHQLLRNYFSEACAKGSKDEIMKFGHMLAKSIDLLEANQYDFTFGGIFSIFYNKLKEPNLDISILELCMTGIRKFTAKSEFSRNILVNEDFFKQMLFLYGDKIATDSIILIEFVKTISYCVDNVKRPVITRYLINLNILVDFTIDIIKPTSLDYSVLYPCLPYVVQIIERLAEIPLYSEKLIASEEVQDRLARLFLNPERRRDALRALISLVENSTPESYGNILKGDRINNYALVLYNTKEISLKNDIIYFFSYLVLSKDNWSLILNNSIIINDMCELAVSYQTHACLLKQIYTFVNNVVMIMDSYNYRTLINSPLLEAIVKSIGVHSTEIRFMLFEIFDNFLPKVKKMDKSSFIKIKDFIVHSQPSHLGSISPSDIKNNNNAIYGWAIESINNT